MIDALSFRPIRPEDEPLLRRIYDSTRADELALVDWDEAQNRAFLAMQFRAQHDFYHDRFPDADFDLILKGGEPIGRLYVDRRPDEIRVLDIALLPEHRGDGIGGGLMRSLLDEAAASGRPVRIHVELFNRAMTLYRRLGFAPIAEEGVHLHIEWAPIPATASG